MSSALGMGIVSAAALGFFDSFVPILIAVILMAIFFSPVGSFADSATMFMLAERKEMYGRVRLGGTFGFGVAASLAGLVVQNNGLKFAFWGCALIWFIALILSQKLVYNPAKANGSTTAGMRDLLANRRWLLFLAIAFVGGFGFSAMANYFLPLMKQVGANESTMGIALTIGTFAEVPIFFFGNALLRWLKPSGLLFFAVLMTALRMVLYAVSATPEFVLVFQLLNGLTFPALWLAGVAYADRHAPAGRSASAQGMFGTMVFGVGPAVGGFIGGPLLESIGGRGLFLVFAVVVLVTLAIVALLQKRLPPEPQPAREIAAQ
jgi:PPP family 3-phenylpropionic acid transporter